MIFNLSAKELKNSKLPLVVAEKQLHKYMQTAYNVGNNLMKSVTI